MKSYMGGPLFYNKSEAATLTAQWPPTQSKVIVSKVAWGQQPLCQPPAAPAELEAHEGGSAPALPNPAQRSPGKRLEENSTGGHGWDSRAFSCHYPYSRFPGTAK